MQVKKLTETEIFHLFGERGEKFENHRSPLVPLHISIHNRSNTLLILDPKNISLNSLSYRTVSKQLQTSSIGKAMRTFGYGIPSAILVVYWSAIARVDQLLAPKRIPPERIGPTLVISTGFLLFIGSPIIAFINSARTNNKIKRDIKEKILRNNVTIHPGQQYDTLLFVRTIDYYSQFTLTLIEKNKNKTDKTITFNVAMKKNNFVQSTKEKYQQS